MNKLVRKTYQAETKALEGEDRILTVRISSNNPDRSHDVVYPKGMKMDNYMRNPVVAFAHDYSGMAVAKTLDLQPVDDGVVAKLQFPPLGVYELADTLYELYKGGFMNAWSIGFIPTKWQDREDGGRDFQEWELLEYSAVLVPDNPDAVTLLRSKGINIDEKGDVIEEKDKNKKDEKEEKALVEVKEKKSTTNDDDQNEEDDDEFETDERLVGALTVDEFSDVMEDILEDAMDSGADESQEDQPAKQVEVKEGRVLSDKNRKLIGSVLEGMKTLSSALEELMAASEPNPKEVQEETRKSVVSLKEALIIVDQTVGKALRDLKTKGELGIVPDDARLPIVVRRKESEK